ncbi:MAG: hypothetical protein CME63_11575 [Halobacteriovoraceae bacterium]|nr:hypothetical protein [Halobacteriovoraceae bacterium]
MKKIFQTILILLCLVNWVSYAQEEDPVLKRQRFLTLKGSHSLKRKFVLIKEVNDNYKIIHFSQDRGDFAYIQKEMSFTQKERYEAYLLRLNNQVLKESPLLPDWEISETDISQMEKNHARKGIFDFRRGHKTLWEIKHSWNEQWEDKYGQWITENVDRQFFQKFGISTDCADAVLGIRWIFARINGLPVANHIATTQELFTNYTVPKKWRKIPKADIWHRDQLFLTALNYVMSLASTRTIKLDTYPVELSRTGLSVGRLILTENNDSNHVKFISENHFDDPTQLPLFSLSSTVPRKVRPLVREVVMDQQWPIEGEKSFLKFRWPIASDEKIYLKREDRHADFSRQQYDEELKKTYPIFIKFLLSRLKDEFSPLAIIDLAIEDITDYIEQRREVVNEGYEFCLQRDCTEGSLNWDNWSTPSRDKRLREKFSNIDLLTHEFNNLHPGLIQRWEDALSLNRVDILGFSLSLKTIRYLVDHGLLSSNPEDYPLVRWGIDLTQNSREILDEIKSLLVKREEIISSQWEECQLKDCFPKTAKWLSWNTFKVDEQLLKAYLKLDSICQIYGQETCFKLIFGDNKEDLSFSLKTDPLISLEEWIRRIPFFYSDLDASIDRRWAKFDLPGQLIRFDQKIRFSSSKAVIDDKKVVDLLHDQKVLYTAQDDEVVILTHLGERSEYTLDSDWLLFKKSTQVLLLNPLTLRQRIHINSLVKEDESLVSFIKRDNRIIIEGGKLGTEFILLVNLENKEIQRVEISSMAKEKPLYLSQNGRLIDLRFHDFREIKINISDDFPVANLQIIDYEANKILFDFRDDQFGTRYPVLYEKQAYRNLISSKDISPKFNISLNHYSLSKNIYFITYLDSEEFPKAYIYHLDHSESLQNLGNQFNEIIEYDGIFYFSVEKGSLWSQNRKKSAWSLHSRILNPMKFENSLKISHLTKEGIFLQGENIYTLGLFLTFEQYLSGLPGKPTPGYLRRRDDYCPNIGENIDYVDQFDFPHGDYTCFGKVYKDSLRTEPLFTIKNREPKFSPRSLYLPSGSKVELISQNLLIWWGN